MKIGYFVTVIFLLAWTYALYSTVSDLIEVVSHKKQTEIRYQNNN
jgi:hypothetical protein